MVLPVEHRSLLAGVVPVVPASRVHRCGHVGESEHDAGVLAPWTPQDGGAGPDARQLAPDEAVSRAVRLGCPLRRERAAVGRRRVQVTFFKESPAVSADEIGATFDVAPVVVMTPLIVEERVLERQEAAPVEGRPVSRDSHRDGRRAGPERVPER